MRFSGPLTTKWRQCKILVKLNRNHILMANTLKGDEHYIGFNENAYLSKIWFANNKFNLWKNFGLRSKMLFFNLWIFALSNFQTIIIKSLLMHFKGSYQVLLRQKYFWSTHFLQRNGGPFNSFLNLQGIAFCFFNCLNERNIAISPVIYI